MLVLLVSDARVLVAINVPWLSSEASISSFVTPNPLQYSTCSPISWWICATIFAACREIQHLMWSWGSIMNLLRRCHRSLWLCKLPEHLLLRIEPGQISLSKSLERLFIRLEKDNLGLSNTWRTQQVGCHQQGRKQMNAQCALAKVSARPGDLGDTQ